MDLHYVGMVYLWLGKTPAQIFEVVGAINKLEIVTPNATSFLKVLALELGNS